MNPSHEFRGDAPATPPPDRLDEDGASTQNATSAPNGADDVFRPEFVRNLFNEMSATYGLVNVVSSLGFCIRWRHQCVAAAGIRPGETVVDFCSGMGELLPGIARRGGPTANITAVDFSPVMCARNRATAAAMPNTTIRVLEEDVLNSSLPDASVDVVVSSFGLKTFNGEQRAKLARETARLLRPGGRFAYLEISVPRSVLRFPYMFYVNRIVPLMGRLMLGNPDNYRLLGVYTTEFGNAASFADDCRRAGLRCEYRRWFWGCATGVVGTKPS